MLLPAGSTVSEYFILKGSLLYKCFLWGLSQMDMRIKSSGFLETVHLACQVVPTVPMSEKQTSTLLTHQHFGLLT